MEDCTFCRIIEGELPASVAYSDDVVMVVLDIQPVNPGHVLVIPRRHAELISELDPETGGHIFRVAMIVSEALRHSGLRCEGVSLLLADGEAAGQEIPHVHLHVVPRFQGDGFVFRFDDSYFTLPERDELDEVAEKIRGALADSGASVPP